jgi:hypothetical protein
MQENTLIDHKNIGYKDINGIKRYFINNKEIGEEYDLIKLLISKGMSSSHAHKIAKKVKLLKL